MLVKRLLETTLADQVFVGEKAALLGVAASKASKSGMNISDGFVFSKTAYTLFVEHNNLSKKIKQALSEIKPGDKRTMERAAEKIRQLFIKGSLPEVLTKAVKEAFADLKKSKTVIVRSSVVADVDVSLVNLFTSVGAVTSEAALQSAIKKCFASLFNNDALVFYVVHSIDPRMLAMALIIEKEKNVVASGTLNTSLHNFAGAVTIEVKRKNSLLVNRFVLAKAQAAKDIAAVIERTVVDSAVLVQDKELVELVKIGAALEKLFSAQLNISWLKDDQGAFVVTQIKHLPVPAHKAYESYRLAKQGKVIVEGAKIGHAIVTGEIRFVVTLKDVERCTANDVVVLKTADASFDAIFTLARAVILEDANANSYGVTVCRERGVPCVYGLKKTKELFKNEQKVTVVCAGEVGQVYQGHLPFTVEKESAHAKQTSTQLMVALQQADAAYDLAGVMQSGVGLLSEETLYKKLVGIHPSALAQYKTLKDKKVRQQIETATSAYSDKGAFATDRLAQAIAKVAVAAQGKEVMFRLSAADTHDYLDLVGGKLFEQKEKNPLLGWRGVSRYVDERFKPAFALTCAAIKRVREEWGLTNVAIMVPFCRTMEEARTFFEVLKSFGLERGKAGLKVYVLCEIPANVLLAKDLAKLFDGFSISLTNLTQLTFGADRTVFSTKRYNEDEVAIKQLVKDVIKVAQREGCSVGMCDADALKYPPFVSFLVQEGITSISVSPDHYYALQEKVIAAEQKLGAVPLSLPRTIISKSFSMAGVAGLSLMLAGFTCQPVDNREVEQKIQLAVEDQLISVRNQVREEVKKQDADEFFKQQANKKNHYSEKDGFASFNLDYPSDWQILHTGSSVTFKAPEDASSSDFEVSLVDAKLSLSKDLASSDVVTTTWFGLPAKQFTMQMIESPRFDVVELYPDGYTKSKKIIRLVGSHENFNDILASIKDFKINK